LGLARLSKVTVISARSEYQEVARALASFEDFHRLEAGDANFDPKLQELTVKAVRLFALSDQAVKDLGLQLMPGVIDIVFRGVKIPRHEFSARGWEDLLVKAEGELTPIAEEVRTQKALLQKTAKEETDALALREALQLVSSFSVDIGRIPNLQRLRVVLTVVGKETATELRNSLPDALVSEEQLTELKSLLLVAVQKTDESRLEKAMKALDVKPLSIPADLPQNPAEAHRKASEEHDSAVKRRTELETKMQELKIKDEVALLRIRELASVARDVLDEARMAGGLKRLATITGYIPAKREVEFKEKFGRWMVHAEPVQAGGHGEKVPVLMENPRGMRPFELVTSQQGIPGREEVDPTPLISFVFPIFFGLMFGDVGHGLILTLFALLIRKRGTGALRQWGNIFLVAGISATVFGALVGEFFGSALNLYQVLSPVAIRQIEILEHPLGVDTPNIAGIQLVMVISILIGIAHLVTGLSLDLYQAWRASEKTEVLVGKLPTLTMYVSGVGYGLAFIGAGFSFNVLKTSAPAPLLGVPNNQLGGASLAVLVVSMIVLFCGRAVAIKLGKLHGESFGAALANGGLEVFERISQFLSNTISYVRLAIMLLVHAVLLLIVNLYFPLTNPVMIVPWVVLNCLIIAFEAFVVYVQDLRLHIYEFFTKFYRGTGSPFRKILPERARIDIRWLGPD
jgi:V/A-type H+-transporting ATPase subunit I